MLKFIFISLLIVFSVFSWYGVQASLFLFRFLFGVFAFGGFSLNQLGYGFGLDYISYILILLSI